MQLELNGFTTEVREAGDGSPAVFVHGGFASLGAALRDPEANEWSWEWELAARHRFVTYHRRGCGLASCPEGGYELENQAGDLELLLDRLEIDAAHVVASSAGGPIAVLFAAGRPARVRSLVLVGTALDLFPAQDRISAILRRQIRLLEEHGPRAAFEERPAGVEVWFETLWRCAEAEERGTMRELLAEEEKLAGRARELREEERLRYHTAELRSIAAYMELELRPYAARVRTPTLVLHGERDTIVPAAWGEELAGAIPGARLSTWAGGHHGLFFESREARREVLAFLDAAERGGGRC